MSFCRTQIELSEALVLASGAKAAVAEYFSVNGKFPDDNEAAGLEADPAAISGDYVKSVEVGLCTFGNMWQRI